MNQNETIIKVDSLEKSYNNMKVLKGISFTVSKGCIFALLGSNGAGKTTTVKILSTLIKPCGGKAEICGFDTVRQGNMVRAHISLTGQYAAVDELMTGRENLQMIGALRHLPDRNGKVNELLSAFNLNFASNRRVSTYSGGMRRRLDLAMSLLGNPSVIFLDEPTTGLDPQSRLSIWKIIRELANSGTTVFLTTQYLEEAEQLADYIAILNEGIIAAKGTPARLKEKLSQGTVELTFYRLNDMEKAVAFLKSYQIRCLRDILVVRITTDGSIRQLTNIINLLNNADVSLCSFTHNSPTLEDVFLNLVEAGRKEKRE